MRQSASISNIINGMRNSIEDQVDSIVNEVADRTGRNENAIREEVINNLKRILDEAPACSDSDDISDQPELRDIELQLRATMRFEAESQDEVDDRIAELRLAAQDYGIDIFEIEGSYDDGTAIDDDHDCGDEACNS